MRKFLIYFSIVTCLLIFLSRCVLCKMRWTDSKAKRIFKTKGVTLTTIDTSIDGHTIHYVKTGDEKLPILIIIHGSPGSWFHYMKFMWDKDLLKKFHMIAFDRPGYGFSDYGHAMHLQDQCKLLLPIIQGLKTKQPIYIIGHSYGGPVVAKLAADAPELFSTMVIAAGALDPGLEKKEGWRHLMDKKPLFWFLPGAFQTSNTELLYLKEDLKPLAADLGRIKTNVLFVHGDKDTWVPIENIAYGEKMMMNAASVHADTVRGASHQIPWKFRDRLKQILLGLY